MDVSMLDVLIIGGSRFSGNYLWKELHERGHKVTLFNRGKTALKPIRGETTDAFAHRKSTANYVVGDRKDTADITSKLNGLKFDAVYDMTGRTVDDTAPLADVFNGKVDHFVYMSSAGIYKKVTLTLTLTPTLTLTLTHTLTPTRNHTLTPRRCACLTERAMPWTS